MNGDYGLRARFGPVLVDHAVWLSGLVGLPRAGGQLPAFILRAPGVARCTLDVLEGVVQLAQDEWPDAADKSAADMAHRLDLGFGPAAIRLVDAALGQLEGSDEVALRLSIARLHYWLGAWRYGVAQASDGGHPSAAHYSGTDGPSRHRAVLTEAMAVLAPLLRLGVPQAARLLLRLGRIVPILDRDPDLPANLQMAEQLVVQAEPHDPSARLVAQEMLLWPILSGPVAPELLARLTSLLHRPESNPETEASFCEGLAFAARLGADAAGPGQDAALDQIFAILEAWNARVAGDPNAALGLRQLGLAMTAGWLVDHPDLPRLAAAFRVALMVTADAVDTNGPALAAAMLTPIVVALARAQRPPVPVAVADLVLAEAAPIMAMGLEDGGALEVGLSSLAVDLFARGDTDRAWRSLELLRALPDRTAYWTVGRFAWTTAARAGPEAARLAAEAAAARPRSPDEAMALVHISTAIEPRGGPRFLKDEEIGEMDRSQVRDLDGRFATLVYENWLLDGRPPEGAALLAEQLQLVRSRSAGAEQPELSKLLDWANATLPEADALRTSLAALAPTAIDVNAIVDQLQRPDRVSLPVPVMGEWRWADTRDAARILESLKTSGWLMEQRQLGRIPHAIRIVDLPFIRDGRLAEIFLDEALSRSGVLLHRLDGNLMQGRMLSGESASLHGFYAEHALDLGSQAQALSAAELFCNNIQASDGCFRIITAIDQLPSIESDGVMAAIDAGFQPPELTAGPAGSWQIRISMLYAGGLFRTLLKLGPNGSVEMEDDEPIAGELTTETIRYDLDRTRRIDRIIARPD